MGDVPLALGAGQETGTDVPNAGDMTMRKIVQIAEWEDDPLALCDDGSLWWYRGRDQSWNRLPDIPQDQPPAKEAE